MAEAGPELVETALVQPRRDSRVRIAPQDPEVIGSEGGDVWCERASSDSSLSTSSEDGPEDYELDPGLEDSEEELERLTCRNTVRNSFSKDSEEPLEELPTVHYCQYDKKEPPPLKNNGAVPPYKVVELPPPAKVKTRPPPRPAQPPDASRRSLPPPPASPPPPLPRAAIVVPPPPNTPPPPTPSSRTKAPPVSKEGDAPIDLPKIVYEEKEGVRNNNFVPIMYASQQAPQGQQNDAKRASGGFKIKVSPVGKLQKGMQHLRKRLTSPESHEPPRGPNWKAARELPPPPPPEDETPPVEAPAIEEAEEERRSRQIVTQKNVRPPKPPPPSRPSMDITSSKPKPKPRLAGGLKEKICDLEDLTCLDSLFPFLSSFLLLSEDAPSSPAVPGAILDLSAQNFLLTWSERWRRRSEKAAGRAKVDGPFQLGECPLQGRKFAVFEAGSEGEKLLALPPEQISPPAFSFCPPRLSSSWRPAHSESSALVAVSCCCPLDRLLALLDAADEPVAPLKRCLALAALVLALASGLPSSLPPSQVLVLLSRHDLRFLLPEPVAAQPSSEPPLQPPPSPLERLAPHLSGPGGETDDLTVALEAFRCAVLPDRGDITAWRREAGALLLPRLFARFDRSDFFAPFLAGLLIGGEL